jgi:hypothetical protein
MPTGHHVFDAPAVRAVKRRGLHLAMEKLEESQRLAAEERKKKAEGEKGNKAEAVAQPQLPS